MPWSWRTRARTGPPTGRLRLRRRLRRHPCHACPDREQHARYAERYFRQKKEADDLERQVAGRRHVIARTFDRVCKVLDELGYLDGDTVTPAGQRLLETRDFFLFLAKELPLLVDRWREQREAR